MKDPLEQVLQAETEAKRRVAAARKEWESRLQASHLDAARIRSRNEQRTAHAVELAEQRSIEKSIGEIDQQDNEANRQLDFDEHVFEKRLAELVAREVDRIWPG